MRLWYPTSSGWLFILYECSLFSLQDTVAVDGSDTELSVWQLLMISSSDLHLFFIPKSKTYWPLNREASITLVLPQARKRKTSFM